MSLNVTMEPHASNAEGKASNPKYLATEARRMPWPFALMHNVENHRTAKAQLLTVRWIGMLGRSFGHNYDSPAKLRIEHLFEFMGRGKVALRYFRHGAARIWLIKEDRK